METIILLIYFMKYEYLNKDVNRKRVFKSSIKSGAPSTEIHNTYGERRIWQRSLGNQPLTIDLVIQSNMLK